MQSFNQLMPVEDTHPYANFIVEEECSNGYAACKDNAKKDALAKDERKTVSTQDYTGPSRFLADPLEYDTAKIGRASCRERV